MPRLLRKYTGQTKHRVTVKDTVTYERTWHFEVNGADSEDAAIEQALDWAANGNMPPDDEEQVDAEPYEAVEVTEVFAYAPDKCPSNHWNRGDDICADCGAELG